MNRQIVVDTETTGLELVQGHRVIEVGCVEIVNRRPTGQHFHCYLNPDRDIDEGAREVHGISSEFLSDKPRFEEIAAEFLAFIRGAELIIHNADFDVGFLNNELQLAGIEWGTVEDACTGVLDTLALARKLHPGQRNSLDALCKRYEIDNSRRELHGALLDAEILGAVYLVMTGGQTDLVLVPEAEASRVQERSATRGTRLPVPVVYASESETASHYAWLEEIDAAREEGCVWLRLEEAGLPEGGTA